MKNAMHGGPRDGEDLGDSGREYCPSCDRPLPHGAVLCPVCGPSPMKEEPDGKGLSGRQAFLRIAVIVGLFLAVALFKLDIGFKELLKGPDPGGETVLIPEVSRPKDKDFRVFSEVRANKAHIREKPGKNGKVIAVVKKGTKVKILDRENLWSKVDVNGNTGWVWSESLVIEIR